MLAVRTVETPFGPITLESSEEAVTRLGYGVATPSGGSSSVLDDASAQLMEYLRGERQSFDLPLAPEGTDFQRSVWAELLKIPYGETVSYGELARRLGKPSASRAVGAANGANPIAIIIPCHRVIDAKGQLHGYAGGLDRKRALLEIEHAGAPLFR